MKQKGKKKKKKKKKIKKMRTTLENSGVMLNTPIFE